MKAGWVLLCLVLNGCGGGASLTPVKVEVPVGVPCRVEPVAKPDFALTHVGVEDDLFAKVRALLVEINQRKAYEALMEAQVEGCRG